jgi:ATP-binding cassette subfamily B protein
MTDALRSSYRLLALSWHQDPGKTLAAIVLVLANAIAVPLLALALKWFTDAAVAGDGQAAGLAGIGVAACAIGVLTLGHFAHIAYFELSEMNVLSMDERLIALTNGSTGIEHHERAEYADKLAVLQRELQQLQNGLYAVLALASLAIAIGFTGVLLALVNPILLLLPLVAVPPLVTGRRAQGVIDRARDETAEDTRLAWHLFRLATAAGPAKELRVFRLQAELQRRHRTLWDASTATLWRAEVRATLLRAAGQLGFAAGYVAAVLFVVGDAIGGRRTVGDVVLAITLSAQVNQQVSTAVTLLNDLQRLAQAFTRMDWLERSIAAGDPVVPDQPAPERLVDGIRLDGVRFRYPGVGGIPVWA